MGILAYLIERLKEPSTYAGLAALLGLVGIKLAPDAMQFVIQVLTGIASLVAILVPDLKKPTV